MDILFVNAQDRMTLECEINGQLLLGTLLLQAGFDVDVLRFCQIDGHKGEYTTFIHNAVQAIVEREPKAVSFYSLWPEYHVMLRIARELKAVREDIYVIFGGPQPSVTAQETMEAMPFIDAICTGEGEGTVVPFFTALLCDNGTGLNEIPGLYYRENGAVIHRELEQHLCDLDTLPYWDDRLYLKHYQTEGEKHWGSKTFFMPLDVGRGCPYRCAFCCTSTFWRRMYRMKSPERIMKDIRFFNEKFGIKSFWFTHDAFTTNMELVEEICDRIIEEGLDITWKCSTRVDRIDRALILKMKRAGLIRIEMGIETGSSRMQKQINKNLKLDMVRENVRFLVEQGLEAVTFFIYGFPNETEGDLFDTVQLATDLLDAGGKHVSMAFCRFNPTTLMTQRFFNELVFDPKIDILSRDVYAYTDEVDMIVRNKLLFPYYYNLGVPLREKYQYLIYFFYMYQVFSNSAVYVKQAFGGDAGKLVRTFFDANRERLICGIDATRRWFWEHSLELLYCTLDQIKCSKITQLKALLQFDFDREMISRGSDNCTVVKEYAFCYADLKQRRPITEYGEGMCKILLQKKDGKVGLAVLKG